MAGSGETGVPNEAIAPQETVPETAEESRWDGLTYRAFMIGLVLCVFLGIVMTYNRMVIQGSFLGAYFMDRGALFVFFCLVMIVNPLVIALGKRYALTRGELLAIYVMFLFLLPAWMMTKPLISYVTGMTYYATPERPDLNAVLPYSLNWLAPENAEVVRGLYEGLPDDVPVPWESWVVPLVSWGTFLIVLFGVLTCLAVIMQRQWEVNERFAFPIMQVPLAMSDTGTGRLGPMFKNRLMWAGFAIPFLIGSINGIHNYYYSIPQIELGTQLWIFRRTTPLPLRLHFAILGYTYFVNLDVSLSIWLFNVISKVIRGLLAIFGVEQTDVSEMVGRFSSRGSAFLALMGMGYILALAGYSVWMARGHLRAVLANTLRRGPQVDDSRELVPYRNAVLGFLGGLLYLGCWLFQTGMSPSFIVLMFFACFVVFLVMARIVNETGFVTTYSPINPSEFVVCAVGSAAINPTGLVTLGFNYAWTMTRLNNLMPHAQGALRLTREIRRKRGLVWAIGVALGVGLFTASYMTLDLGYAHGGLNLDRHFHDYAVLPFDAFVASRMLEASPVFTRGFWYTGLGIGIAAVLMVLRTRFVWWPLHPVALPLSTIWFTDTFFFSVFLAWGIKAVVLKFGGANLYRTTRPFFMGIIIGEVICSGVWIIIDYCIGMFGVIRLPLGCC